MRVEFTGRHIEVTEPIRQFTLDRLERLRSLPDVIEVHFVLTHEGPQRHIAEVNLKTRDAFLHCADATKDMYTSIASVVDKLERKIEKSKTRHMKRRRKAVSSRIIEAASVAEVEPELADRIPEIIRSDAAGVKPLNVDEAATEIVSSGSSFLLFRNAASGRLNLVYKRKDGNIGWMDPNQ